MLELVLDELETILLLVYRAILLTRIGPSRITWTILIINLLTEENNLIEDFLLEGNLV